MQGQTQALLNNVGIFRSLSPSDRDLLGTILRPRSFTPNEIIFMQGDEGEYLYIIQRGRIKICINDSDGNEIIFAFLADGDILGEMAILDGKPRSATAVAVENTETFYIDRREFIDFLNSSPGVCIEIIGILCNRLRDADKHLEEISVIDVGGRLARKLLEMSVPSADKGLFGEPNFACYMSQEELAKVVGASRVMVNKLLNSFADLGFISIARKQLTILNTQEMNRIARYEA